jgi:hypothetical protein
MPLSPDSSSADRTGARPSPALLGCSSHSPSPSPAWDTMAPCSGRLGLPICICARIALLGEREPPTECQRAGTEVRLAREGASRCHRSGRRRMRPQARRERRGSPSRRKRPRAGSSRGLASPSAAASSGRRARRSQTASRLPRSRYREGNVQDRGRLRHRRRQGGVRDGPARARGGDAFRDRARHAEGRPLAGLLPKPTAEVVWPACLTSFRPCRPCRPCRRPCRLRPFRVARRRSPRS